MKFEPDQQLIDEHRRWLRAFDPRHGRGWEKLLAVDGEAAMSEASVRHLLENNGTAVSPNTDLNDQGKSPDFICHQDDRTFYVEATCISIAAATEKTGLAHLPARGKAQHFALLNNAIFAECCNKTRQCSGMTHACLVAVCTFHYHASCLCVQERHLDGLLTGEPLITWKLDGRSGRAVGDLYQTTQLRSATFLKPEDGDWIWARLPISGVLVCGLGCHPQQVLGVLHPKPKHPFDPSLLPLIRFGRVIIDDETSTFSTAWLNSVGVEKRNN